MTRRSEPKAFTLIELLVVMTIIMTLAALLLVAITGARRYVNKAKTASDISNMMTALTQYYNDFAAYPPGGTDVGDDGNLDNDGGDVLGAGTIPADPNHPLATELQLRTITAKLTIEGGNRTVGPYYAANQAQINKNTGQLTDTFGFPFRYLADGRRTTTDPSTGQRMQGRVDRGPVIWSVGPDGHQELTGTVTGNDNVDNNGDGKVDDPSEVGDDICSWN